MADAAARKPGLVTVELNKTIWEVPNRYTIQNPVGIGAYGQVVSALDKNTSMKVAIKKLARPFQTAIHAKRTYRELHMLKHMNHENVPTELPFWLKEFGEELVINLMDCFTPTLTLEDFSDVYMVTPLMGADLNNILKTQRLSDDHVQFLIYQILRALKYIHSAGILHRDLKPGNIAVNEDCELKILDFGLARHTDEEMTGYVATRWYRAPEIMLNWMHYNQTVDIWSVGCIMAEMMVGRPLFPGTDHIDQLTRILSLVGTPSDELMHEIKSNDARMFIKSLPHMQKKDFKQVFMGANPLAVDLLERMLDLNTKTRLDATQALAHEYLKQYADPNDEPTAEKYDQSFEDLDLSINEWKKLVWEELENFSLTHNVS